MGQHGNSRLGRILEPGRQAWPGFSLAQQAAGKDFVRQGGVQDKLVPDRGREKR